MALDHANEYQIRTVREDGTEALSGWMDSEQKLAQAMAAIHRMQGETFWLQVRSVPCSDCFDKEPEVIVECPIANLPSPRYRPHDSHYLLSVGSRSRYELLETVQRRTP